MYFLFRVALISLTSLLTTALQIGFWARIFRDMRCGTDGTSAFFFAQVPAYGAFRVVILLFMCLLFLYNFFAPLYVIVCLLRDFPGFIKAAQCNEKEAEEGTYWHSLGAVTSRHASQFVYGGPRLALGIFLVCGAELTLNWNKVPFSSNLYELGQVTFLILGIFALLHALLIPSR